MAVQTKKTKPKKKHLAKQARQELSGQQRQGVQAPDPFSKENIKKLAVRIGIPTVVAWVVAAAIGHPIALGIAGALTLVVGGVMIWGLRFAKKARDVAEIVRGADTAEERQEALEKLGQDFKQGDAAAMMAKAQLQMQDDPRAALATLESINLKKAMTPIADETRSQRAMIHLMLGETNEARTLVDHVDLTRHKEHKVRATLASVIGEAWARTGQARKAAELLETFDPSDDEYQDLRPQLYRSLAFAYAWSNQTKKMKQVLRKLNAINVQLLMGFVTKKKNPQGVPSRGVHPALEKEAFAMVMRSGKIPRKMQVKRM